MNITYGRLSPYELDKQGSNPFLEQGGRRYRITELVPRMDGGANYQAVETEEEPVLEIHNIGMDVGFSTEGLPGTVLDTAHLPVTPLVESGRPDTDGYPVAMTATTGPPPLLGDWAKREGLWRGRGPIPKDARERYHAEFGVEG